MAKLTKLAKAIRAAKKEVAKWQPWQRSVDPHGLKALEADDPQQ
jgi:hypothetical protein